MEMVDTKPGKNLKKTINALKLKSVDLLIDYPVNRHFLNKEIGLKDYGAHVPGHIIFLWGGFNSYKNLVYLCIPKEYKFAPLVYMKAITYGQFYDLSNEG